MKHEGNHKLDVACLGCVKKHIEHKKILMDFVKKISKDPDDCISPGFKKDAEKLLMEIEADNER